MRCVCCHIPLLLVFLACYGVLYCFPVYFLILQVCLVLHQQSLHLSTPPTAAQSNGISTEQDKVDASGFLRQR